MTAMVFFFWLCLRSCWILVPQHGMEPQPSAAEPWTPKHWTTREVPRLPFIENLRSAKHVSKSTCVLAHLTLLLLFPLS